MYGETKSWTIIDPEPNPIDTNARFIKGYFPADIPNDIDFDVIVHSHVWEHAYSPSEFIEELSIMLPENGKMVFSIPNLRYLMENKMTSILNFEHTVYLSDYYVDYLLNKYGFEIERKEFFENHSVIYKTRKIKESKLLSLEGLYDVNKKLFNDYIESHINRISHVNKEISRLDKTDIYLFGGHISSQFYIAFGLETSRVIGCIDNDHFKWGKHIGGTKLLVESPSVLRGKNCPTVILPAGPYTSEIKAQIINDINRGVNFVEI